MKSVIREVVKEELKPVEDRLSKRFDVFEDKIITGVKSLLVEFKNDLIQMKLEILGELQKTREEQVLLNARSAKINKIEDDVESLKKIHPKFSHAAI